VRRLATAALALAAVCAASAPARAAGPYVERGITLPGRDWAFDFGMGVGRLGGPDVTAPGINAEMAVSPVDRLELGLRTGIRLGDDAKRVQPDYYGRLFDRQTFDAGGDVFANPEFRVRGALVRAEVVELALEGRIVLPIANNTNVGMMFGVPLQFHIGHRVRLDTGAYIPVVFDPQTQTAISAPIDVWIQASRRVWLGPMSGFVLDTRSNVVDWSLGFGFGYQITGPIDFKAMLLFPDVNHEGRDFGVGAGVQIRIE
jgi:hypothetical protein